MLKGREARLSEQYQMRNYILISEIGLSASDVYGSKIKFSDGSEGYIEGISNDKASNLLKAHKVYTKHQNDKRNS